MPPAVRRANQIARSISESAHRALLRRNDESDSDTVDLTCDTKSVPSPVNQTNSTPQSRASGTRLRTGAGGMAYGTKKQTNEEPLLGMFSKITTTLEAIAETLVEPSKESIQEVVRKLAARMKLGRIVSHYCLAFEIQSTPLTNSYNSIF